VMSYTGDYRTQIPSGNQRIMTHAHNKESRPQTEADSPSPPPQHHPPGRIIALRQQTADHSVPANGLVRVQSTSRLLEVSPYLAADPPFPPGQADVVTFSQHQDAGIMMNQDALARSHGDRAARQSLSSLSGALTLDSPQSTGRSLATPATIEQHAHHPQQSLMPASTLPRIPELQTTQFPMSRQSRPATLATGTGSTASSHSAYSMNRDIQYPPTQRQSVQRFHPFSSPSDPSVNYSVIQPPLGSPETSYALNVGQANYPLPYQASQQWHASPYHSDPSWPENPSAQYHAPHVSCFAILKLSFTDA
jgi:hypothetical protein